MLKIQNKRKSNQNGIVSIVVTLIIMLVLTLIVTGFAQLARREQREALDRQLNTQAIYAAESGINATEATVRQDIKDGDFANYSDCSSLPNTTVGNNASTTCILVRKNPFDVVEQRSQVGKSTIMPLIQANDDGTITSDITDLTISWQNSSDNLANNIKYASLPPGNLFTNFAGWGAGNVSVLRVDLIPVNDLNPISLRDRMFTAFIVPVNSSSGTGTVAYTSGNGVANQGKIVAADCVSSGRKKCNVTITGLGGVSNAAKGWYIRYKPVYNTSDVVICPSADFTCNSGKTFVGAQATIDVTAKAADVLKRIQVRINVDPNAERSQSIPEYTLDSAESICKLLTVTPTNTDEPACP